MIIKSSRSSDLIWESLDPDGETWFSATISLLDFSAVSTTDEAISNNLKRLLKNAVRLNSEFLSKWNGFKVETQLEFSRDWGLGSSSTLIYLIAEWAEVTPLELYFKTESGSGYDVACADNDGPIAYISSEDEVSFTPIDFNPSFTDQLYFVHLGKKQDTKEGIKEYLKKVKKKKQMSDELSSITDKLLQAKTLKAFEDLIEEHESIVAAHMGIEKIKDDQFSDFWGSVKSLGAWGGDFVLVTSTKDYESTSEYFKSKGLNTVLPYKELIL